MVQLSEAHEVVRQWSTTWYEPVMRMPPSLNEAVTSAYLCMRAIDEIEDHPRLAAAVKARLLCGASGVLQGRISEAAMARVFGGYETELDEVTLRLAEWALLAAPEIGPRVIETFATMAERMAAWALAGFQVRTETDLDRYTYSVSGTLVLMLSDLWAWYDGTRADRTLGISYGRALQAVNITKDKGEDLGRGVDFWPDGWQFADMHRYATAELALAEQFVAALPDGPARDFHAIPLEQARRDMEREASLAEGAVS
jgi:farnesyl-diphosphate farnesyltransferase